MQQAVLDFYFHLLESNERVGMKFKAVSCLLSVLELVCSDCFEGAPEIYYTLKERELGIIYKFLNC